MTEIQDQHGTIDGRGAVYDVFVGKDLGWAEVDTGPSAIDHYIDITGDDNPWYRGDSPFGEPLVPATFLHFRAFQHNPGWFPENQYGTLFAGISLDWNRPLLVGERTRSHAWVSRDPAQRPALAYHLRCRCVRRRRPDRSAYPYYPDVPCRPRLPRRRTQQGRPATPAFVGLARRGPRPWSHSGGT